MTLRKPRGTITVHEREKTATADLLDDELLRAMARRGGVRSRPAQVVLVSEEDRADALHIVLSGRVKAYGADADGREVVYGIHGAGEYFGELTLDGGPRAASVMTLGPTRCAVVPGAEVREPLAGHPDFALHIVLKPIKLLRSSTAQVKSLALEDVYGRVARLLRKLAREEHGMLRVPEKLTQQNIAERAGSSRGMVSRILKPLTEGGYVERRDGHFVLLKPLSARG